MAVRESRNAIKIEQWRVSRVPINSAETLYAGDMLGWDPANKRATKITAATSGFRFMGVNEHDNPVLTAGALTSNPTLTYTNVVQKGLVEMIAAASETLYPFDLLTVDTDAQTVKKSGATTSNAVGMVDPSYGTAGKAVVAGSIVLMWLRIAEEYDVTANQSASN